MTIVMLNAELMDVSRAMLPVTDRALTHGLGLYETLKLIGGYPVFYDEHMTRLDAGLAELGLERPCTRAEMAEQIRRLLGPVLVFAAWIFFVAVGARCFDPQPLVLIPATYLAACVIVLSRLAPDPRKRKARSDARGRDPAGDPAEL